MATWITLKNIQQTMTNKRLNVDFLGAAHFVLSDSLHVGLIILLPLFPSLWPCFKRTFGCVDGPLICCPKSFERGSFTRFFSPSGNDRKRRGSDFLLFMFSSVFLIMFFSLLQTWGSVFLRLFPLFSIMTRAIRIFYDPLLNALYSMLLITLSTVVLSI